MTVAPEGLNSLGTKGDTEVGAVDGAEDEGEADGAAEGSAAAAVAPPKPEVVDVSSWLLGAVVVVVVVFFFSRSFLICCRCFFAPESVRHSLTRAWNSRLRA